MKPLPIILLLTSTQLFAGGLARDKQLHLAAGALVGGAVTLIAKENGAKRPELWGSAAAILAGALKEASDRRKPHNHWDGKDFAATSVGGIVVSFSFRF